MKRLENRVAVVAGASRGIGKAIALELAREGARVAVVAREGVTRLPGSVAETAAAISAAGGTAIGIPCDVADAAQVPAMVGRVLETLGAIDILVNSAAVFVYESTLDTSEDAWDRLFAINTKGPFLLTRAVLPGMIRRRSGHIIHLTGSGARELGTVTPATGASKAALERFTLGVAHDVREHNVAVNLFDPGPVKTERSFAVRGELFDWTGFAAPAEVAPAAVHLATQTAASRTGTIFSYAEYAAGRR